MNANSHSYPTIGGVTIHARFDYASKQWEAGNAFMLADGVGWNALATGTTAEEALLNAKPLAPDVTNWTRDNVEDFYNALTP